MAEGGNKAAKDGDESLGLPFESGEADRAGEPVPAEEAPLAVSELVGLVAETLEESFGRVLVMGELTSFKQAPSGHCYFTLSDDSAAIDCAMWRSDARRLKFEPAAGDEVVCRGRVGVYEVQGRMQLYVSGMQPVGAGAAQRALEELKRKLEAEGLFDPARKRPLPFLPRTVGVVTSRTGAAIHDILTTIRRRFSHCHVVLSPAVVQGETAPESLLDALDLLDRFGECDVVIFGRGGGAAEDLAVFNDERVVRAVAGFGVPVVSAVGHETDVTLCDFVADHRAATPTAAAEAVVPVRVELLESVRELDYRLGSAGRRHVEGLRHRVGSVAAGLKDPATLLAGGRQRVDEAFIRLERSLVDRHRRARTSFDALASRMEGLGREYVRDLTGTVSQLDERMRAGINRRASRAATDFAALRSKLDAMSPLAVLERGYSLATKPDGKLVRRSRDLSEGDELSLRFHEGKATAKVVSTAKGDET